MLQVSPQLIVYCVPLSPIKWKTGVTRNPKGRYFRASRDAIDLQRKHVGELEFAAYPQPDGTWFVYLYAPSDQSHEPIVFPNRSEAKAFITEVLSRCIGVEPSGELLLLPLCKIGEGEGDPDVWRSVKDRSKERSRWKRSYSWLFIKNSTNKEDSNHE